MLRLAITNYIDRHHTDNHLVWCPAPSHSSLCEGCGGCTRLATIIIHASIITIPSLSNSRFVSAIMMTALFIFAFTRMKLKVRVHIHSAALRREKKMMTPSNILKTEPVHEMKSRHAVISY